MVYRKTETSPSAAQEQGAALSGMLKEISEGCTKCKACQKECAFLRKYGKPGEIAEAYDPADDHNLAMAFECSLCRLCAAGCPAKINPAVMFLEMRRERMRRNPDPYPEHGDSWLTKKRGTRNSFLIMPCPPAARRFFLPVARCRGRDRSRPSNYTRKCGRRFPYWASLWTAATKSPMTLAGKSISRTCSGR